MYQRFEDSVCFRQKILDNMYSIIGESIDKGLYAFKGGYILSKKVKNNIRRTSDIDMTILNNQTFYLVISSVTNYVNSLIDDGIIWGWDIKEPLIVGTKNISGYIKLYVKESSNSKKRILCGLDISILPLGEGIELGFCDYPCYSDEYMLADKVSALYSDESKVIRRIRDIFDIYLILSNSCDLNISMLLDRLKVRHIDIKKESTYEYLLKTKTSLVFNTLDNLLSSNDKVDLYEWSSMNVSTRDVLLVVCKFFSRLRKG